MAAKIQQSTKSITPELILKIDAFDGDVNDAIILPGKDSIITGSSDRQLCIWLRRENGKFWPSVVELLPRNGTVVEYHLSEDLNHIKHKRDFLSHTDKVNGVLCVAEMRWIISISEDNSIAWCSTETGRQLCNYQFSHGGTCIEYDSGSRYVFVGDKSGCITLLSFNQNDGQSGCRVVRELRGHEQAVTSLSWDSLGSRLFSTSADNIVIYWDIGGSKGSALKLHGHSKSASCVRWWSQGGASLTNNSDSRYKGLIVSGGLDGLIIFWSMDPGRIEAPNWSESDVCQLCSSPFFWNVRKIWDTMSLGQRQHHCRMCGYAVCERCSPYRSTLPYMGFEKEVRVCAQCFPLIKDTDRRSLTTVSNARHPITRIYIEESLNLLITIGKDRSIKIWDIKCLASPT